MDKLLVVIGPTATGKTSLGIELAKKLNGEVISADSRQVYKFMDIGTGKDSEEYKKNNVKVWGIDLVDPGYGFNVSDYVEFASKTIKDIQNRGKLPLVVGGTALYIKALLEPFETVNIPSNASLRNSLSSHSLNELQDELQRADRNKWEKMNDSDRSNPRRLIRAIEISKDRTNLNPDSESQTSNYDCLIINMAASNDFLYKRIDRRVDERINEGAIDEVKNLLKMGYTFFLPSMSASGYKEFKNHQSSMTNGQLTSEELSSISQRWKFDEHAYARRQISFINKFVKDEIEKGVKAVEINIEDSSALESAIEAAHSWYINSDVRKKD